MNKPSRYLILGVALVCGVPVQAAEFAIGYSTGGVTLEEDINQGPLGSILAPHNSFNPQPSPGNNGQQVELIYWASQRLGLALGYRSYDDVATYDSVQHAGVQGLNGTTYFVSGNARQPIGAGFNLFGAIRYCAWDVEVPESVVGSATYGAAAASGTGTELDVGVQLRVVRSFALSVSYTAMSSTPLGNDLRLGIEFSFGSADER